MLNYCPTCTQAMTLRIRLFAHDQAAKHSTDESPVHASGVIDLLVVGMRPPAYLKRDVKKFLKTISECKAVGHWPCDKPAVDTTS